MGRHKWRPIVFLQNRVSAKKKSHNHLLAAAFCYGDEEDRTPDLQSAILALSQLSYIPLTPENLTQSQLAVNMHSAG